MPLHGMMECWPPHRPVSLWAGSGLVEPTDRREKWNNGLKTANLRIWIKWFVYPMNRHIFQWNEIQIIPIFHHYKPYIFLAASKISFQVTSKPVTN